MGRWRSVVRWRARSEERDVFAERPSGAESGEAEVIWGLGFLICDLRFAICDLRFAICDLRFAICDLRFAICDLRFAICDAMQRVRYDLRSDYFRVFG